MWDVGDGGDGHNNNMHFGDLAFTDGKTNFSVGWFMELLTVCAVERVLIEDQDGANGWRIRMPDTEKAVMQVDGIAGGVQDTALTVDSTVHSIICAYDGADVDYFLDGAADGTQACASGAAGANATNFVIGANGVTFDGVDCKMGQVMFWDTTLVAGDAAAFHSGGSIPQSANLGCWVKCIADPDEEVYTSTAGTKAGTITVVADAVDSYFQSGGGFAFLLSNWVGPILGGASLGANLIYSADLWAYLQNRMGRLMPDILYTAKEQEALMDLLYRRPVYGCS
jgi:hypothetical protein